MRPKTTELVQHGGLAGWLEESDPAGVILCDGQAILPAFFHTVPYGLTGAAKLKSEGISCCCHIVQ